MATVLAIRTPLSHRQLTVLRAHILHQRKKAEVHNCLEEGWDSKQDSELRSGKLQKGDETITPDIDDKIDHTDPSDRSDATKETEAESPEDIARQIEAHQIRLESLREEKHRLFRQLKTVLHEEDERKRVKEVEQKQELDKNLGGVVSHLDPRLSQSSVGLKRSLPTSPPVPLPGNQDLPVKKPHRAPLLPTPDATAGAGGTGGSATGAYMRQGSGGSFRHAPGEGYHNSSRQLYPSGTHVPVGQRAPFPDQRFGPAGHHDTRVMAHPQQANLQPGIIQHPAAPVYSGSSQALPFQYASASTPYGAMSGVQPPANQTSQLHYQQMPRFIHPHEVPMQGQYISSYGQPLPHEVHLTQIQQPLEMTTMQGHGHFVAQGGQMMGTTCYGEHTSNMPGVNYTGHIQDPRHQKVMDHHRSTPGMSPSQISKQESYGSVLGSPSSPIPSSRDRKSKKEMYNQ